MVIARVAKCGVDIIRLPREVLLELFRKSK